MRRSKILRAKNASNGCSSHFGKSSPRLGRTGEDLPPWPKTGNQVIRFLGPGHVAPSRIVQEMERQAKWRYRRVDVPSWCRRVRAGRCNDAPGEQARVLVTHGNISSRGRLAGQAAASTPVPPEMKDDVDDGLGSDHEWTFRWRWAGDEALSRPMGRRLPPLRARGGGR
jgi:hypothetical protein